MLAVRFDPPHATGSSYHWYLVRQAGLVVLKVESMAFLAPTRPRALTFGCGETDAVQKAWPMDKEPPP
jgi:hypothetical protein